VIENKDTEIGKAKNEPIVRLDFCGILLITNQKSDTDRSRTNPRLMLRRFRQLARLALLLRVLEPGVTARPQAVAPARHAPPPPVELTAEQDHQRMMGLLHITALRPGADPQEILKAAVARGVRLSRFELVEPPLHDIFIEKVSEAHA
jgi:hypothetical protein